MRPTILVLALLAIFLAACAAPATPSPGSPAPPSPAASEDVAPTSTAAASPAASEAAVQLADRLEATIPVAGSPDWPLAAFDSIWVVAPDLPIRDPSATPNVVRIDPAANRVVATIPLPDRLCQGIVASDDAVWACSADGLVRIDPAANAVAETVPIDGAADLFYQPAFGGGMVWALGDTAFVGDTVIRLDPATKETTSYPMPGPVGGLTYAFDALWLTIPGDGSVVRLDPATGQTAVGATGLPTPTGITAGSDSLWVSLHGGPEDQAGQGDPQLARIDPTSGEVLHTFEVGGSPQGGVLVWAGEGGVLVRSTRPWLVRIDEATNEVVQTVEGEPAIQGPLVSAFGSIWTVNIERDDVLRLRP